VEVGRICRTTHNTHNEGTFLFLLVIHRKENSLMLNPKGGTFGGTCEKTELFAKYYDEMLDKSLQEGFLGTHPQS